MDEEAKLKKTDYSRLYREKKRLEKGITRKRKTYTFDYKMYESRARAELKRARGFSRASRDSAEASFLPYNFPHPEISASSSPPLFSEPVPPSSSATIGAGGSPLPQEGQTECPSEEENKPEREEHGERGQGDHQQHQQQEEEDEEDEEEEEAAAAAAALRKNDLGRMLVALLDSKERRVMNHVLEIKEDTAAIKARLAAKERDEMEVKLNIRQLVGLFRSNNSVESVRRQLGLPWTSIANICAVVDSQEQTQLLERHVRDMITNHGGHWHLRLNIELFDKEFLSRVFVDEGRLVPPEEDRSTRPIHFCMEEYWLLPPGLATIVKWMIEDRKKRQHDENDPVYSDKLETKFHSVTTVYAAWAKDVQNKRNQAKWPKIHKIQARVKSQSTDLNDWELTDFFYNMIIMVSGSKKDFVCCPPHPQPNSVLQQLKEKTT